MSYARIGVSFQPGQYNAETNMAHLMDRHGYKYFWEGMGILVPVTFGGYKDLAREIDVGPALDRACTVFDGPYFRRYLKEIWIMLPSPGEASGDELEIAGFDKTRFHGLQYRQATTFKCRASKDWWSIKMKMGDYRDLPEALETLKLLVGSTVARHRVCKKIQQARSFISHENFAAAENMLKEALPLALEQGFAHPFWDIAKKEERLTTVKVA